MEELEQRLAALEQKEKPLPSEPQLPATSDIAAGAGSAEPSLSATAAEPGPSREQNPADGTSAAAAGGSPQIEQLAAGAGSLTEAVAAGTGAAAADAAQNSSLLDRLAALEQQVHTLEKGHQVMK